jgi:lysozyme
MDDVSRLRLRGQIARDEGGYQRFAYPDSEGYWTIGFGRCIDKRKGKGISLEEAERMLDADIRDFTADVLVAIPWAMTLGDARLGALVNIAFNVGVQGLLGFKKALAAMERGQYQEARTHFLDSKWARQVGPRAPRLADQIADGEWR